MVYKPGKCCKIIVTCMVLHNICIEHNIPLNDDDEEEDENDDDDAVVQQEDENEQYSINNDGFQVRRQLVERRFNRV